PYRDNASGEGANRSFGDRRTSSDRPPRRDDDARPRRAGADEGKRPSYRDNAAGEGANRSYGDRRPSSDRPPRRDDDTRPRRAAGGDDSKRPSYR
ncbi:pseudouridine synthase, partial [Burkholderia cenocepacia]|nr:pseudouridine synthase [Burkholderia cenocepacia]